MKNKKKTKRWLLPLTGAVVLAAAALLFLLLRGQSDKKIRNVILISIDTCRADYLSCYGYQRQTTPNIDRLAEQSYVFTNTITPIPLTLPAHFSMLTGTIPPYHGRHDNKDKITTPSQTILADLLQQKGFVTGAFISSTILNSQFGLNQGFNYYEDYFEKPDDSERKAEEITRHAISWMEKNKNSRFFLFLHYYDPHDVYEPPEPFATQYKDNLYAGEIAYTDYHIGKVIDKLKEMNLYDSSLIIVTGDHGEMLGEHGEETHMFFIYQSALHVPLIIKFPGAPRGDRIDDLVGLIDIVPTVCEKLDIEIPSEIQGQSLCSYFGKKSIASRDRHIYCESLYPTMYQANSLLGVVTNRWKYIQTTRPELYDLLADPNEQNNMVARESQRARILQDRLAQILEQTVRKEQIDRVETLDEQTLKHLRSLGYVAGSTVTADFSFDQTKEDPKDLIGFHTEYRKVTPLVKEDKHDQVIALCEKLIKLRPDFYELYDLMSDTLLKQQDYSRAIPYARKAIQLKPGRYKIHYNLGEAFVQTGQEEAAAEQFNQFLKLAPKSQDMIPQIANVHSRLGYLRARQEKFDLAITHFRETLRLRPNLSKLHILAWTLATCPQEDLREPAEAVKLALKCCEITQFKEPAYINTLAVSYAAAGDFPEAVKTARRALDIARLVKQQGLIDKSQMYLKMFESGKAYYQQPKSDETLAQ
ncbi:MAG: sulfatase-like hydrolase/transferase [Sedimentisphaerales bacterium]|nr:sulfatase-like hydrolase/transferase [Sedimentisphaerales bacterium]